MAGIRPKQPWKLQFKQMADLADHLLACPTMSNPGQRESVLAQLRLEIAGAISHNSAARIDVLNIITTVLNYPGGLEELLGIVYFFEGDSQPWQNLEKVVNGILPNFQAQI
jgi:hypothetical protein